GWLLRDAQRRPVRCFLDTDGDDKIDLWCYYRDGNEAYREIDANFNGKPDEYRWLGPNGSRWGTDADEDGRIDAWKAISPEEVSQEVLRAVITRDFKRLQALMITKAELDALDLPEAEASRIRDKLSQAGIKFQKTAAGLIHLSERTRWVHLETEPPECLPADSLGSRADLVRYRYGSILYENDGKHDWLQTGEMIQVGRAWRITDAPVAGSRFEQVSGEHAEGVLAVGPEVRPLLEELRKVDEAGPAGGDPAETARHSLARAAVLEKIVAASPAEQKPQWVRQLADSLASAAQNGDDAAYKKLVRLRDRLAAEAKGDNLAGYVAFREMSADYSRRLREADPEETAKVQEHWQERLKQFVNDYPGADDAPEALMQLGMVSEFTGKETEARNWYTQLVKHHPRHLLAARAAGAVRRLDLEGKPLELSGPVLGTQEPFDISRLRGKVVIVYYWASWNQQTASDFARLKGLLDAHEGVELVTVNLDTGDAEAINFLRGHPVPGTHLHQPPGGLESPLATQYGVLVLPNMFLVGKDGKVVNRNAQIVTLEDDLKKLTK
ncbi:MAG TPA: thioredoxin-like domain-containing protein, partial [Gemmataceae bacterium]